MIAAWVLGLSLFTGESALLGEWLYTAIIFEGRRYDRPNPNLRLTFTFREDQTARLFWTRLDEIGFCEREGTFQVDHDMLQQRTTWVNPKNRPDCAQDPDMQPDRESFVKFTIEGRELWFHMDVDGQEFVYILERQSDPRIVACFK